MLVVPPLCDEAADVTWTCTFNGRLEALLESLESFLQACKPATLRRVRDWVVVCDGGASVDDRVAIVRRAPWLTVIAKGSSMQGHARSLNLLSALVRTKWWLQWEDDWRLERGLDDRGLDIVERALDAATASGCAQVAVNGAFLDAGAADYELTRPPASRHRRALAVDATTVPRR